MARGWQNEDGEPIMSGEAYRFEAQLDADSAHERMLDAYDDPQRHESRHGCGTTGCEAHDGECADNWGEGDAGALSDGWSGAQYWTP